MHLIEKNLSRRQALGLAGSAAAGLWLSGCRSPLPCLPANGAVAPARDAVELNNGRLRVVVSPSDGAGLLAVAVKRGDRWIDVAPDVRAPGSTMRYCSWMMIPYSNRIENGVFTFGGREYKLRNGDKHSIHGDGRNHPWTVVAQKSDKLVLRLRSADFADFNWPWPLEAVAELALEGDAFVQRLSLRNRGTSAMPAGFGWHPYLLRSLTQPGEPVLLQARFTGVYPDANGDCIPDGLPQPVTPELDYSQPKQVPADTRYDLCTSGYDGKSVIAWPRSNVKLTYDCSPNVTHFVYFNPIDRPVWAAEPAANANNGVNLLAKGDPSHGVITLPAGQALTAHFAIRASECG